MRPCLHNLIDDLNWYLLLQRSLIVLWHESKNKTYIYTCFKLLVKFSASMFRQVCVIETFICLVDCVGWLQATISVCNYIICLTITWQKLHIRLLIPRSQIIAGPRANRNSRNILNSTSAGNLYVNNLYQNQFVTGERQ